MDENVNAEARPAGGGGGGSKMVPLLLVTNTLLMGGVLFLVMKKPAAMPAAPVAAAAAEEHGGGDGHGKKASDAPGPMLKLDNFIIQLKTSDTDRYVRVAFDLEVHSELDKEAVTARLSQVRDSIISYFSDRTLDELRGSAGMERTKEQLFKRLDELIAGRRLKAIYMTDFIVQ
jgi:flagellar basal body-associated protein FliL